MVTSRIASVIPGTALSAACDPLAMALVSAVRDDSGRPALKIAGMAMVWSSSGNLLATMALKIAVKTGPSIVRLAEVTAIHLKPGQSKRKEFIYSGETLNLPKATPRSASDATYCTSNIVMTSPQPTGRVPGNENATALPKAWRLMEAMATTNAVMKIIPTTN